jgi:hypothetical protein
MINSDSTGGPEPESRSLKLYADAVAMKNKRLKIEILA